VCVCDMKDDLVSKLESITRQLSDVQTDRDQLSARLDQLHKVILEVEEGRVVIHLATTH